MMSLTVKKLDAFKFGVAESDNTASSIGKDCKHFEACVEESKK